MYQWWPSYILSSNILPWDLFISVCALLLTIKDVSIWLNIKCSTLYRWAAHGKIPCLRIHGLIRFDAEAVQEWVKGFSNRTLKPPSFPLRKDTGDLERIIAVAKAAAYTPRHGETGPKSSLIRKGEHDGAE